jgi:hypothetical protein
MVTKESLIAGTMIILIAYTVGLSLVNQASPVAQTARKLSSTGTIETIGVGVYTDTQCSCPMTSLQWGKLEPGGSQTVTCYIRNEGNLPSTLSMYTSNWNPSNSDTYLSLSWDYGGQLIEPGKSTQVTFTLSVDANIEGITDFSFDITIVGTG